MDAGRFVAGVEFFNIGTESGQAGHADCDRTDTKDPQSMTESDKC